jgi:signal transduction histidine kinase/HPt (histidine-containing phosphotransfer) domain-containing protein/ActR/RegA family two-component response regulator
MSTGDAVDIGEYIDGIVLALVAKTINHVASIADLRADITRLKVIIEDLNVLFPARTATSETEPHPSADSPFSHEAFLKMASASGEAVRLVKAVFEQADALGREIAAISRDMNEIMGSVEDMNEARLKADAESRSKSSFLARMSHEIRTPLNTIVGMSELAERAWGGSEGMGYIRDIKGAGANLLSIINEILDYSRMESGVMEIANECYSTASLLNDVTAIARVRLVEKPVRFDVDVDENIPAFMMGDEVHVRHVLLQLLSNAIKYTKSGFIKFTVRFEYVGINEIKLIFVVSDSGIGIKDEEIEGIFGGFSKLDVARNGYVEGVGLGLTIARSICRALGGDIDIASEYGRGSAFTATIRQGVVDDRRLGPLDKTAAPSTDAGVCFHAPDVRVLVVDDIAANLKVMEGLLAPYDLRVSTCASGERAVELAHRGDFDLVFMDHMMPGMDGVEATRAIRTMNGERCRVMPIIALTANAVSGMREMFLENGFNDFLSKPIETAKLDAALKKWIPADKRRNAPKSEDNIPDSVKGPEITLPEIAGVDVTAGLARIGGSRRRYLDLLEIFRRDTESGFALLERTPDEDSLRSFITLVHGLKSALANIGANELSQTAALLEGAGREADMPVIRDKLPSFRDGLAVLMARIDELTTSHCSGGGEESIPPEMREAMTCLIEALKAKNFDMIDSSLARLQDLPLGGNTRAAVSELTDLILTADLQKAEEILTVLLRRND